MFERGLIHKYRHDSYPNLAKVNSWVQEFLTLPVADLNKAFTRDRMGHVALLTKVDEEGQVCLLEVVLGKNDQDGTPEVSAAGYRPASFLADVSTLLAARRDVIETLEDIVEKPLGADAGIYDEARKHDVNIRHLSFSQLYDLMVSETRKRGFAVQ